jgi:hypothetical protein
LFLGAVSAEPKIEWPLLGQHRRVGAPKSGYTIHRLHYWSGTLHSGEYDDDGDFYFVTLAFWQTNGNKAEGVEIIQSNPNSKIKLITTVFQIQQPPSSLLPVVCRKACVTE